LNDSVAIGGLSMQLGNGAGGGLRGWGHRLL